VLEILSAGIFTVTSYEELLSNALMLLLVMDSIRFNTVAKWFNSNPCASSPQEGNPLLKPSFGVLRKEGTERLRKAHHFFREGMESIVLALEKSMEERGDRSLSRRLLVVRGNGEPFWDGLVEVTKVSPIGVEKKEDRLSFQLPTGRKPPALALKKGYELLRFFLKSVTPYLPVEVVKDTLRRTLFSMDQTGLISIRSILKSFLPPGGLNELLTLFTRVTVSDLPSLNDLETPFLNVNRFFLAPIGDLKLVLPLFYLEDEPFTDANGIGIGKRFLTPGRRKTIFPRNRMRISIVMEGGMKGVILFYFRKGILIGI